MKTFTFIDRVLIELEHNLRTCHVKPSRGARAYPAEAIPFTDLTDDESRHVAGLMRVNNAGEVAAQGLYRGQAVSARRASLKQDMLQAALEENEHLDWCQTRLSELGAQRSTLDPVWYWGSFTLGLAAGLAGDKWSLGFVEETEKQVSKHLEQHIQQLPAQDNRTRQILSLMKQDELRHATHAHQAGAAQLPGPIQKAMTLVSKLMTFSAYRI